MKTLIQFFYLAVLVISIFSCSNEFLDKNNRSSFSSNDTIYVTNNQSTVDVVYSLAPIANKSYTVTVLPKWITLSAMNGQILDGSAKFSFTVDKQYALISQMGTYNASIVLDVEDSGLISIPITYVNFGNPTLQCSTGALNFESLNPKTFIFSNISDGYLAWKISNVPDWLILSKTSGSLYNGQSETITVSWNNSYPTPTQDLASTLHILNNSANSDYAISVTLKASAIIPRDVSEISGIVTDVEFHKSSGIMAICTKSPNSLILYNTTTNKSNTIALTKTPACISISEDGHKAVIGYTVASLSYIDIDKGEIAKDYDIDCLPYDVVLGDNSWCYITPTVDQWVFFRSLNLNTGVITVGKNWSTVYEKTMIKKIPGKPYLVGSRMNLSPTGILLFDVSKGIASDTISYWHESIGKFWISEDGKKLFTSYRKVYQMPSYDYEFHTGSPSVYGQVETSQSYISAFDQCTKTKRFFVVSSVYWFSEDTSSKIEQFDSDNLNKINEFEVAPIYLNEGTVGTPYQASVRYVFVDQSGSILYAIKSLNSNDNKVNWSIEKFKLE
jgi:hypothetical protein